MNADGWITIGTKLSTDKFDKELKKLTQKKQQKEIDIEIQTKKVDEAKEQLNSLIKEYDEFAKTQEEILKNVERMNELEFKGIDNLSEDESIELAGLQMSAYGYEEVNEQAILLQENISKAESEVERQNQELEKQKHIYNEINDEIEITNTKIKQSQFNNLTKQIGKVGSSIEGIIKKTIRWGLAIFSIRSAYLFVRQAMSTLTQYNEQLAGNLEYIRFVMATALEPLIIKIVEWVYKLLSLVGTIIKLLTGYDIFKNSSVDKYQKAMEKSSKSLASGAKSAEEINKQLAGFDEMNVLSDNSSSGAGGGGGAGSGVALPDLKLTSNMKLPKWMTELLKNGDKIIAIIAGIVAGLTALKLGFAPIQALGIGVAIAGIVYSIEGLLKYLNDPSWANFGQIIQGIGIAVIGLGIAFFGLPAIIAGVIGVIIGTVIKNWDKIKGIFDEAVNWLTELMNNVQEKYGFFAGLIVKGIRDQVKNVRDTLDTIFKKMKDILDNIISLIKNVFTGNWKGAWKNIVNIGKDNLQILLTTFNFIIKTIKNNFVTAFGVIGDVIGGIIKGTINAVLKYVETKINDAIGMINSALSIINKIPGVKITKISKLKLPKLAQGGIINYPSKGVPIGGAIGGERGAEGVIPLTDSQQMALLGEAIGKYITINANITNTMNGRVISRELKTIQNQTNFATNGR